MGLNNKRAVVAKATVAGGVVTALVAYYVGFSGGPSREGPSPSAAKAADTHRSPYGTVSADPLMAQSVELSTSEFAQFKVEPAAERVFTLRCAGVGTIDCTVETSRAMCPH